MSACLCRKQLALSRNRHASPASMPPAPADEEFPGMRKLETSSLHRGVAGARHSFLPLPPAANKLDMLVQVGHEAAAQGSTPPALRVQAGKRRGLGMEAHPLQHVQAAQQGVAAVRAAILRCSWRTVFPWRACSPPTPSASACCHEDQCSAVRPCPLVSQVVEGELGRGKRIMVFCNTLASCRAGGLPGLRIACGHPCVERRGCQGAAAAPRCRHAASPA